MRRLPVLRSASLFARWEGTVRHNLTASAAETMSLGELLEMADLHEREAFESLALGYIETCGSWALRQSIASTYQRIEPDDILGFSSGKEAIFAAIHAIVDEDDEVLTFTPSYQPLEDVPRLVGRVQAVAFREDEHWRLDLEDVRKAIGARTRLICLNVPHNPTGTVLDSETFNDIIKIAADHGAYILVDEVYRGLEQNPGHRLPQIADIYDKGLSLNVMSKTYGLPGLRVGWLASRDRHVLERISAFKDFLSDGNAGPSEFLARIALRNADVILARNRRITGINLARLDEFFRTRTDLFEWQPPPAGCIAFPRYKGADGVEAFCARAVDEAGILLLPASTYASDLGPTPQDRFRIGFGKLSFDAGLDALAAFLAPQRNLRSSIRPRPAGLCPGQAHTS